MVQPASAAPPVTAPQAAAHDPRHDPRVAYLAWCAARNKALVAAHTRGTSLAALGRQYGISRQRAWTIVARAEARKADTTTQHGAKKRARRKGNGTKPQQAART